MSDQRQSIYIGKPYIEEIESGVRLCASVTFQAREQIVWFSVDKRYGSYLVSDRADAFVAAVLTTAMRGNTDIVCEAPVTRRLLYQLNHYLIPMMAGNMPEYHFITIHAETANIVLPCAGAVVTGWTGGVDSMYTLMKALHAEEEKHRLTHLFIANNGALEEKDNTEALRRLVEKAENGIAEEVGLEVVGADSNLQELMPENFLAVASFRHAAVILALQKLFGVFLCSSAYEFSKFSFDADNGFYYELASFGCFETDCTVFYSAYGAFSRVQKLKELSDFPLAQKYLHPCIEPLGGNCGRCGKCVRTEAALYGLGTLEKFSGVFDIEEFERNKDWYLANVLAKKESQHYGEALALFKRRGIELSENAKHMARIMRAADAVVKKNKEWLADRILQG